MLMPAFHSNMNFPAPLSVLGFLAGALGTILASLAVLTSFFFRKPKLARVLLAVSSGGVVFYFTLLLAFSIASRDTLLRPGEEKYFCEIDCHLAYSVVGWKIVPAAGVNHYVVTVRTRFDANTISAQRPKSMPLYPGPREVKLVDSAGNDYPLAATAHTALSTPLTPGGSYLSDLDFEVPAQAREVLLLICTRPGWQDHVLIGDENSWLHKKTFFQL